MEEPLVTAAKRIAQLETEVKDLRDADNAWRATCAKLREEMSKAETYHAEEIDKLVGKYAQRYAICAGGKTLNLTLEQMPNALKNEMEHNALLTEQVRQIQPLINEVSELKKWKEDRISYAQDKPI